MNKFLFNAVANIARADAKNVNGSKLAEKKLTVSKVKKIWLDQTPKLLQKLDSLADCDLPPSHAYVRVALKQQAAYGTCMGAVQSVWAQFFKSRKGGDGLVFEVRALEREPEYRKPCFGKVQVTL